jgi:hypothetical protein
LNNCTPGTEIQVSNLNDNIKEDEMKVIAFESVHCCGTRAHVCFISQELFGTIGNVLGAFMEHRGICCVTMEHREDALASIREYNERTLDGRAMVIKLRGEANERKQSFQVQHDDSMDDFQQEEEAPVITFGGNRESSHSRDDRRDDRSRRDDRHGHDDRRDDRSRRDSRHGDDDRRGGGGRDNFQSRGDDRDHRGGGDRGGGDRDGGDRGGGDHNGGGGGDLFDRRDRGKGGDRGGGGDRGTGDGGKGKGGKGKGGGKGTGKGKGGKGKGGGKGEGGGNKKEETKTEAELDAEMDGYFNKE